MREYALVFVVAIPVAGCGAFLGLTGDDENPSPAIAPNDGGAEVGALEGGLTEELAQRREELLPEIETQLKHLEGCLNKLPAEQRSIVEGYYYRRDAIEKLAEHSGRTVGATYKTLQRVRQALQICIENAAKGVA